MFCKELGKTVCITCYKIMTLHLTQSVYFVSYDSHNTQGLFLQAELDNAFACSYGANFALTSGPEKHLRMPGGRYGRRQP